MGDNNEHSPCLACPVLYTRRSLFEWLLETAQTFIVPLDPALEKPPLPHAVPWGSKPRAVVWRQVAVEAMSLREQLEQAANLLGHFARASHATAELRVVQL